MAIKKVINLLIGVILMVLCCGCEKTIAPISPNNVNTRVQVLQGASIIANNYHANLNYFPVVSTESVSIKVSGRELTPEIDFVFPKTYLDSATGFYLASPEATLAYMNDRADPSDGYQTGTIKILKPDLILSTSEVVVTYTYYKSVVGRYVSTGEGTVGPYYLSGIKNIVPGSEIVQVWRTDSSVISTYTRNSLFETNAGSAGYAFNYNKDNPSIIFNEALASNKSFQIVFQMYDDGGLDR